MSAEKKFSLIFLALQCNRWLRRQRTCLQQGDLDSTPRSGRCPGEWNGNSYQYSFLENPLERGAWRAIVHGVANNSTLQSYSFIFCKLLRMDYLQKHRKWTNPVLIFIKEKKNCEVKNTDQKIFKFLEYIIWLLQITGILFSLEVVGTTYMKS